MERDYISINKNAWNIRTGVHMESSFYQVDEFIQGATSLNSIELDLLGDVQGKSILHLQCHFGQDSLSLQRLGAQVTGVDLSDKAIEQARILADKTKQHATFICADVYDLPNHLTEKFDIVFTSYGTIGWLPDMDKWANVVTHFLKPSGKFVFVEFHPVVWMFDHDFTKVGYDYFNTGPIIETEKGTYADKNANIQYENIGWNHSLGEVLQSLVNVGLQIKSFSEFDYSPYNCLNNMVEFEPHKYHIKHIDKKIPLVYALLATKM